MATVQAIMLALLAATILVTTAAADIVQVCRPTGYYGQVVCFYRDTNPDPYFNQRCGANADTCRRLDNLGHEDN
jgi:hypothetical protein